jgi:hypothetical protein
MIKIAVKKLYFLVTAMLSLVGPALYNTPVKSFSFLTSTPELETVVHVQKL